MYILLETSLAAFVPGSAKSRTGAPRHH
jgi:hypothetical protein